MAGDLPHSLALQYLKPGSQTQYDTSAYCIAALAEKAVGRLGGVAHGQAVKKGGELLFRVLGQHLVYGGQVPLLRLAAGIQVHIEDKAFEQIRLAVIPEMVPLFSAACIGDDDICEYLSHESIAAQVKHTIPGVA